MERTKAREASMTSLGLTFHSQPTPALCILTSLRYVSYIPSFPLARLNPPPDLSFSVIRSPRCYIQPASSRRKRRNDSSEEVVQGMQPPGWLDEGCRPLVSSFARRQMLPAVLYLLTLIIIRLDTHDLFHDPRLPFRI